MDSPKISIITAVLNCEKYVERAIKSVINQDYSNIEYIVIDGESTDSTLEIIDKYKDKIAYFVSEPDKGNAEAQNKGVKAATGDYVAYLAGDDWYDDGVISKIAKKLKEHPDADVITCAARSVKASDAGELLVLKEYKGKTLDLTLKSVLAAPLTNSRFFKKSLYEQYGYPKPINYQGEYFLVNDREFMIRLSLANLKNYSIEDFGPNFFGHRDSMTFSGDDERAYKIFQEYLDICEDFLDNASLNKQQINLFRKYHRKESVRSTWRDLKNGKISRALDTAKRGFLMNPVSWVIKFVSRPFQIAVRKIGRILRGK